MTPRVQKMVPQDICTVIHVCGELGDDKSENALAVSGPLWSCVVLWPGPRGGFEPCSSGGGRLRPCPQHTYSSVGHRSSAGQDHTREASKCHVFRKLRTGYFISSSPSTSSHGTLHWFFLFLLLLTDTQIICSAARRLQA
ncbi:hypothetical protein TREMEDRAFT_64663 [Tremella mesenterica DSM 1558]|uniref:uncharacterized protein n=1 Tax=Tremella mesenterica (strain ATCC 24925 / CBS 8224 / DSM 1558 / NBRC 9311 / NRRL Y-6157 / RJB 2259-6 / UBC 559-6) TaxID=578456 RepID=UPI0003F497A1|nr:uncharacterized protein TREMEDRAFT_64663 [Tremella mesenterica DSM 1558]EIW67407.1 hypothetical protein TREMEDRAFT_64663 [Tremella mesenterica DSM 1558]